LEIYPNSNSQSGGSIGSVVVHSLAFSYTPRNMKCDFWASLLARTFAGPCLGRKPKVRVVIIFIFCPYLYCLECALILLLFIE